MEILYFSSTGPMVALLQLTLNELGYDAGSPDGIFGQKTLDALKAFQKNSGLAENGVVWPQTWDKLSDVLLTHGVYTSIPYSSNILNINLHALSRRYPFVNTDIIGYSPLGEAIYRIRIGAGSRALMFNASHHANEWITSPLLMKYIFELCASYDGGEQFDGYDARLLLENIVLDSVPMVNPDGADLVTGQLKKGSAIYNAALSMNEPPVPFPDGWKANIRGVDLNLNYPAGWEKARELKFAAGYTAPGPRDYVGPYPLSEPESAAMAALTEDNDYILTVSLHTQGEVIFWTFEDYKPPRALEIGQQMSLASGYRLDEPGEFSSYAGYKDWFIQQFDKPGYTPECGLGINPLPIEQFDKIYSDVRPMLTAAAAAIAFGQDE